MCQPPWIILADGNLICCEEKDSQGDDEGVTLCRLSDLWLRAYLQNNMLLPFLYDPDSH